MKPNSGWTKTPNAIYDAIPSMSAAELLCTLVLVRETTGYQRRQVKLTYAEFMRATGIGSKATVAAALRAVERRGFFQRTAASAWRLVEDWQEDKRSCAARR